MTDRPETEHVEHTEAVQGDAAQDANAAAVNANAEPAFGPFRAIQIAIAGVLMGMANLIPGVSGGTMVLAMGVYQEFIDSVADITALRFRTRRIIFLAIIGCFAAGSIVGLSGVILTLLFKYPVAMFSLFIGLTLGGVPLLLREVRPLRADVVIATVVGFGLMLGVLALREGAGFPHNPAMDVASGVVGATTMVLPGISGSYMLLIMNQYDRVVGSVRDLKDVLKGEGGSLAASLGIVVPVGVGAVIGIIALSNLLKVLLHRFHRPTVGVLLGILLGSVVGLWPFDQGVGAKALEKQELIDVRAYAARWQIPGAAELGDNIGEKEALIEHIVANWKDRTPPAITTTSAIRAVVMVLVGFGVTFALSRLGGKSELGSGRAARTT